MTMLRGWGIWLPSHDQELFSQYGPKNGQQQVEANKDRQWGHLPLHREWQKPGDNLFASEAGELHCFQHRAITQGQIVVEKIAVTRPKVENRVGWSHPTLEIISREDLPNFVALRLGPCEPPGINRLRAMAHGWSTEWFKSYRLQSVLQSRE